MAFVGLATIAESTRMTTVLSHELLRVALAHSEKRPGPAVEMAIRAF